MTIRSRLTRFIILSIFPVAALAIAATVTLAQSPGPPAGVPGIGPGPGPANFFRVQLIVDSQVFDGFIGVSGLTSENEIVEFREGTDDTIRKLPGRIHYGNITLKRGVTGIDELWTWRQAIADGETADRRSGSIVIYDADGTAVSTWHFERGWPAKWEGPSIDAGGTTIATETITLAVERIEKD